MKPQRLDKFIAEQAVLSRREATHAIRIGKVTVNGAVCREPACKIAVDAAVTLHGEPLTYREHLYIMLHKPAGLLCVSRDPKAPTVIDLVPAAWRRTGLFPAGRLDKDTRGLVLLTDDGDWAHRLTSPKKEVEKVYLARLDAAVGQAEIDAFAAGTHLPDGTPCRPARLRVLEDGEEPLVELTLTEGKYHQVKRMFGTHGCGVNSLFRASIGGLALDSALAEGECRLLTEEEQIAVFAEKIGSNL